MLIAGEGLYCRSWRHSSWWDTDAWLMLVWRNNATNRKVTGRCDEEDSRSADCRTACVLDCEKRDMQNVSMSWFPGFPVHWWRLPNDGATYSTVKCEELPKIWHIWLSTLEHKNLRYWKECRWGFLVIFFFRALCFWINAKKPQVNKKNMQFECFH